MLNDRLLDDESRKTAVCFHCLNDGCHGYQLTQSLSSVFRHSELLSELHVDLLNLLVICVRNVYELTAICIEE